MNIKWKGSPNFTAGRGGHRPLAIIDHIMAGTLSGTDSWFANKSSQVSAHFGVGRNGEIHQYVREEDTAWANGRKLDPDAAWMAKFPAVNPNQWTISIEHEGYPDQPFTEAQVVATIELHRYLANKWNIPIDDAHITGHFRIDSKSRKNCPGPNFPWQRLFTALKPAPKVSTPTTPQWKFDVLKEAECLGIITKGAHKPEEQPDKAFVLATILNALKGAK